MDDIASSVGGTTEQPGSFKSKHYIKHLRWYIAVLLLLATTVGYLDRQTLSIAAPVLSKKFNMSNIDYSHILMAFLLSYAIMQPLQDVLLTGWGRGGAFRWRLSGGPRPIYCIRWPLASSRFPYFDFCWAWAKAVCFQRQSRQFRNGSRPRNGQWRPGILNTGAGIGALIAPPLIGVVIIIIWLAMGICNDGVI